MKYGSLKKVNILLNEPLPTEEEFHHQKLSIALEYGLHIKDAIDYRTFLAIYKRFCGILPEELFAEKIFDISKPTLNKMKNNPEKKAVILGRTKVTDEEIKKLRREVIFDNNIYPEKPITLKDFKRIYKAHNHILSEKLFAELVL